MSAPAKHIPTYELTGTMKEYKLRPYDQCNGKIMYCMMSDLEFDIHNDLRRLFFNSEAKRTIKNKNARYKYWTNKMRNERT